MSIVGVNREALVSLLDYAQPDEEADFEHLEEGNSAEHHIVHAIRALRAALDRDEDPVELRLGALERQVRKHASRLGRVEADLTEYDDGDE